MCCMVALLVCSSWSSQLLADNYPTGRINAQLENARQPVEVDLADLKPGEHREALYLGRPVWIYRRTSEDLQYLESRKQDHLANPESTELIYVIEDQYSSSLGEPWARILMASQLQFEQEMYRSENKEYLVVMANSPLGCTIKQVAVAQRPQPAVPFLEVCAGTWFDVAGRLLKSNWVPPAARAKALAGANLLIPPHYFMSPTQLVIGLKPSQTIPQIDLAAIRATVYARLNPAKRLAYAAIFNDIGEVRRQLQAMDQNPAATVGSDVLDSAIYGGSMELIELLIKHGARPTDNSREIAKFQERPEVISILGKFEDKRLKK